MASTNLSPMPAACTETRTLIDAAADLIPEAQLLHTIHGPTGSEGDALLVFGVPDTHGLQQIDTEHLLTHPRRAKGSSRHLSAASLVDYLSRHETAATCLWINLDPATNALSFRAVLDDHGEDLPGWRGHVAEYVPRLSVEWQAWVGMAGKPMPQADFAAWMEDRLPDISHADGLPSGADMLAMLLDFEAKQDMRVKSSVRLQSGGTQLEYVNTDDAATIARMKVFDRFAIAIPVFWGAQRFPVAARLRYRIAEGKVKFWFDLVRHDRVHEAAALEEIMSLRTLLNSNGSKAAVFMGQM